MSCNCFHPPLDRLCRRAQSPACRYPSYYSQQHYDAGACRPVSFWPCWNSSELMAQSCPRPCCMRCGCCDSLERQGRFVRCCRCGWIGIFDECYTVCRSLRSCCDNLVWPCRPGEPR